MVCEVGVSWAALGHMLTRFPLSHVCFRLWTFRLSLRRNYYHSKVNPESWRTSLAARMVENLSTVWETGVQSLGQDDPLEEGMAAHSSILAWRIPWTQESHRLQSRGCKESDTTERLNTESW